MPRDKRDPPPEPTPKEIWTGKFAAEIERRLDLGMASRYARTVALQEWVQHAADDSVATAKRWTTARGNRKP